MNPFLNTAEARSHKGSLALIDGDYKTAEKLFVSVIKNAKRDAVQKQQGKFTKNTRKLPEVFPILYVPVEVSARELDARLLLSMQAARYGFHVMLAQSWSFLGTWSELPPGVALFKTMNTLDASNMQQAKERGHIICAIDEEGIGRPIQEDVFRMNLDPVAVSLCDRIFTQGQRHTQMMQKIYKGANTVITGNPRAELYGEAYFSNKPDIHLFCSRAGNVNPAGRTYQACVQTTLSLAGGTSIKSMAEMFARSTQDELRAIEQFAETAREVSKEHKVVVRPHPTESPFLWHHIFRDDDIIVNGQGSLREWLSATEMMYCLPECGTEHEAMLAGVPVKVFGEPLGDTEGLFESGSACERIVAELVDMPLMSHPPPVEYLSKNRSGFQAQPFHRAKFPETELQEIINKAALLKKQAGFEDKLNISQIGDNQFYIRPC